MALDDLHTMQQHLPELFDFRRGRDDWHDGYIIVPVTDPDNPELLDIEGEFDPFELLPVDVWPGASDSPVSFDIWNIVPSPAAVYESAGGPIPGAPLPRIGGPGAPPPPDALAFYLPFHYFPHHVWGIYLTLEGVLALREHIRRHAGKRVSVVVATHAARAFLHAHEFFHHQVESFATRLEVDRRKPLYRAGFETLFRRELAANCSTEEALATAYSLLRVRESARRRKWSRAVRDAVLDALRDYVGRLPANYSRGLSFEEPDVFREARDVLAEASRAECFGGPMLPAQIWRSAPQSFRGIADVTSRVNYLVPRGASLASRHRLAHRYFSPRGVPSGRHTLAGTDTVSRNMIGANAAVPGLPFNTE